MGSDQVINFQTPFKLKTPGEASIHSNNLLNHRTGCVQQWRRQFQAVLHSLLHINCMSSPPFILIAAELEWAKLHFRCPAVKFRPLYQPTCTAKSAIGLSHNFSPCLWAKEAHSQMGGQEFGMNCVWADCNLKLPLNWWQEAASARSSGNVLLNGNKISVVATPEEREVRIPLLLFEVECL